MSHVRRLACCAGAWAAVGLGAQASVENRVPADGRSGTFLLRFQEELCRAIAFTTPDQGVPQIRTRLRNHEPQVMVATTPGVGDEFYVEWQPGEIGSLLDLGSLAAPGGGTLFERVTVNEAQKRFETRSGVFKRLAVRRDHIYLLELDGPTGAARFVLPGDPMYVKLLVTGHEPGVQVSLRWAILNEPFRLAADLSVDVSLLPRLAWAGETSDDERKESERLLAQVVKGDRVDAAVSGLVKLGHKMLPAAANVLCTLDARKPADVSAAWAIDRALCAMVQGRSLDAGKDAARAAGEQLTMVRFWYGFARRTRTEEAWQKAIRQQPSPLPAKDPHGR